MPQEGCCGSAAGGQKEERHTGQVDREGAVALLEDLPPALVVQEDGLQLGERADGQKHVEELMPVANNVTGAREVLLRNGTREEVGADEEEEDLQGVVPGRLLLAASQVAQGHSVRHGADVEDEGQPRGHHLADLLHDGVGPLVTILGVATAGAGQPAAEGRCRQEEEPEPLVPGLVGGVEEVHQGAAVLVHAHANVVHEVEGVVGQLGLGLQQVGQHAEREVRDRRQHVQEQGQRAGSGPGQGLGLGEGPEAQEDGQSRQQVGPDIDHLVVFLEEAEEVVAPPVSRGAVASADVRLPEELGHVRLGDGARHLGQPILQDLGQAAQLLPADGQGAQVLQDGSSHGFPTRPDEGVQPKGNQGKSAGMQ